MLLLLLQSKAVRLQLRRVQCCLPLFSLSCHRLAWHFEFNTIAAFFPLPLQVIEELSKGIVNKLLHGPMTALRCDGADPSAVTETLANMEALERMFGLAEDDLSPAQVQKVAAKAGGQR